jgi:transcriptional regulator with XRE-family HTH domain
MRSLLQATRKRAKLSQDSLGELLGYKNKGQTVSDWELGKKTPKLTPARMLQYCQALNVTLDELVKLFEER